MHQKKLGFCNRQFQVEVTDDRGSIIRTLPVEARNFYLAVELTREMANSVEGADQWSITNGNGRFHTERIL